MNTHVDFKIAKLLKEKGFNEPCVYHYDSFGDQGSIVDIINYGNQSVELLTSAPTISQVVMWLHETHEIWISVDIVIIGSDEWEYCYSISYLPKEFENTKRRTPYLREEKSFKVGPGSYVGAWNTPTEAYSAAIEYCLTKLI